MAFYEPTMLVYHFCEEEVKWEDGKAKCEARTAKLAKDASNAHHEWLLMQLPEDTQPWYIGGRAEQGNVFKWLDGSAIANNDGRWAVGYPIIGFGTDFMALVPNEPALGFGLVASKWIDRGGNSTGPYICESPFDN